MLKKFFHFLLIGLGIGFLVTVSCLWLFSGAQSASGQEVLFQVTLWMAASMLFGAVSILFEFERLSQLAATAIHFVLCLSITLVTAFFAGYVSRGDWQIVLLSILVVFLIVYAAIYGVTYLITRQQLRRVNEKLQER